jgi:hypothetical protein
MQVGYEVWGASIAGVVVVSVVVLLAFLRRRRSALDRARKCAPLATFFTELSKPDVPDKRLAQLFDPRVLVSLEKGMLKAIHRCMSTELGLFLQLSPSTARLTSKRDETGSIHFKATAECNFAKQHRVRCEVSWTIRPATNRAHVLSFRVKPPGQDLDVLKHVVPADFEAFGERFVGAMMSRTPDDALEMMAPSLLTNVGSSAAVTEEMVKVVKVMGGFKDGQLDLTLTDSSHTTVGPEGHKRRAIALEYLMLGKGRDVKITLSVVFSGMKAVVLRYTFVGLAVKGKHVFVNESGEPIDA